MTGLNLSDKEFLEQINKIVTDNISDDRFGVSELAYKAGMSRSNLLRKIKKLTGKSVSQFIRNIRLEAANEILKSGSFTVSEVSFNVGFSSTSYFIKCFHDLYGFSPGEIRRGEIVEGTPISNSGSTLRIKKLLVAAMVLLFIVAAIFIIKPFAGKSKLPNKSIAVLPFINDSNDSTNIYFINGLMESILNKLEKIEDLRVVSRTTAEKYRKSNKSISEIGKELNVAYIIEGSGQKSGEEILLNIQLIEAASDRHLWSEQYQKDTKDIFDLQREVARNIASYVEATITPEEDERIEKAPTDDIIAYDYFLQGLDRFNSSSIEGLEDAIVLFGKAIEHDNNFARAYANTAISYFILEIYQTEKENSDLVLEFADKAMLYDPELEQSLIAKSLYYIGSDEPERALPFLEKAHNNSPNSATVLNILLDFYTTYSPDTEKYLEYALKGIKVNLAENDSFGASILYLHIGNSFMQTGFPYEAEKYMNKSLNYQPENLYSQYVMAFIDFAQNEDLEKTRDILIGVLNKDPSRYDIIQELAKIYYYLKDYNAAYTYYSQFLQIKVNLEIDVYSGEDIKIAWVLAKNGKEPEAAELLQKYKTYAENDRSIYKNLSLAAYYSYTGKIDESIEHLRLFSQETKYNYLVIPFLKIDPVLDNVRHHPEYKSIIIELEQNFSQHQNRVRESLIDKGLLE